MKTGDLVFSAWESISLFPDTDMQDGDDVYVGRDTGALVIGLHFDLGRGRLMSVCVLLPDGAYGWTDAWNWTLSQR